MGDLILGAVAALETPGPGFVYAYHPGLDTTGHVRGCSSEAWALELAVVDRVAAAIAERLPPGRALVVTGDHGMVDIAEEDRVDLGDSPDLAAGVRFLGGEARARHVYVEPGATGDVLAAWGEVLRPRMWVVAGDQAVEDGWFGPRVADHVRPRIGDVVAAAKGAIGVFERAVDAMQSTFVGHHGSLTRAEVLVPLAIVAV